MYHKNMVDLTPGSADLTKLISFVETLAPKILKTLNPSVFSTLLIAAAAVEQFSQSVRNLDSQEKLTAAIGLVNTVINVLVQLNLITSEQAATIQSQITSLGNLQNEFVSVLTYLANNSSLIQTVTNDAKKFLCFKC